MASRRRLLIGVSRPLGNRRKRVTNPLQVTNLPHNLRPFLILRAPVDYFDLERVTGFEPVSGPWQGPILAARRYPPGASGQTNLSQGAALAPRGQICLSLALSRASGENRTLLASLEGWNSTDKSHSLKMLLLTFSCQRTHFSGSARTVRSLQPCAPLPELSAVKTHWSGTPDSNRESHDPKSCGLSRFPSARKKSPRKSKRAGLSTGPVMRILVTISYGAMDLHAH